MESALKTASFRTFTLCYFQAQCEELPYFSLVGLCKNQLAFCLGKKAQFVFA